MSPNDDFLDPAPHDVFYAWAIGVIVRGGRSLRLDLHLHAIGNLARRH